MLNKKNTALILIITFVLSLSLVSSASAGATETWFKPNVNIPGMERWLGNPTEIDAGPMQGQDGYRITPDSIGAYISGIYDFVAGFVGIVAMFMLVIAGWQWLFASGNAERINNAKQTINGVLIGLALLFGGHILLEQISVNLTQFSGISVSNISGLDAPEDCGSVTSCGDYELEDACYQDVCNLAEDSKYCVSYYNNNRFNNCGACPATCACSNYSIPYVRDADPCDCDGDGKRGAADTDGCND